MSNVTLIEVLLTSADLRETIISLVLFSLPWPLLSPLPFLLSPVPFVPLPPVLSDKLVLSSPSSIDDTLPYVPELESYKKPEKEYCINITANVIRNDPDQ